MQLLLMIQCAFSLTLDLTNILNLNPIMPNNHKILTNFYYSDFKTVHLIENNREKNYL
jgi:hypothetical protein